MIRCIVEFIQGVPYSSEGRSGVKYKDTFIKGKGASHVVRIMPNSLNVTDLGKAKMKRLERYFKFSTTWIIGAKAEIFFVGKSVYNVIS